MIRDLPAPSPPETEAGQDGKRLLEAARLPDHLDRLLRSALALCGSPHDAEDLVQETFARVLRRPRLLRHEERHTTQYAFCFGPVMVVAYLVCAGVSLVLCGDHASYNPFERLANLDDGGYDKRPLRFAGR
jgi:hypothetical protein